MHLVSFSNVGVKSFKRSGIYKSSSNAVTTFLQKVAELQAKVDMAISAREREEHANKTPAATRWTVSQQGSAIMGHRF